MTSIATGIKNRRRTKRFAPPKTGPSTIDFGYPKPRGGACSMRIKDISAAGVCFELDRELPGLEIGQSIDRATLCVQDRRIRGDLLVMHITPDNSCGAVCGALFYPEGDENILAMQALMAELEQAGAARR